MNAREQGFVNDIVDLDIRSLRATLNSGLRPLRDQGYFSAKEIGFWLLRALCVHAAEMRDGWIQEGQYDLYIETVSEHPRLMANVRKQILKIGRLLFEHGYRSKYGGAYTELMKMEEYEVAHAVIEALDESTELPSYVGVDFLLAADEALAKHPAKIDILRPLMRAILTRCDATAEDIHGGFRYGAHRLSDVCKELIDEVLGDRALTYRAREEFLKFSEFMKNDGRAVSAHRQIDQFLANDTNWKEIARHWTHDTSSSRKRTRSQRGGGATKRRKQKPKKHRNPSRKR